MLDAIPGCEALGWRLAASAAGSAGFGAPTSIEPVLGHEFDNYPSKKWQFRDYQRANATVVSEPTAT